MTLVTNKHLLPVYHQPMVYYPIQCLVNAGITEVMIVTGEENAGDFIKLLRNGKDVGLDRIEYAFQVGEGGIADGSSSAALRGRRQGLRDPGRQHH